MKRSLYRERDYAFGQLMLTLRTQMGLTQASLAQQLRVSRRAVSTWELGSNYPASAHLKELIVLGGRASGLCGRARGRGDPGALEGGTPEGAAR